MSARRNDAADVRRQPCPELRIVDVDLAAMVDERLGRTKPRGEGAVRKVRLLTGILKCGACGAGMAVSGSWKGRHRVQCTRYRESRSCTHSRSYFIDHFESIALSVVKAAMTSPEWIKEGARVIVDTKRRAVQGPRGRLSDGGGEA